MKKIIKPLTIVFVMLTSIQMQAQVKFGLRAGLNLANMSIKGIPSAIKPEMVTRYNFGGIVDISLTGAISIETGLLMTVKGYKYEFNSYDSCQYRFTKSKIVIDTVVNITRKGKISPIYYEIPINFIYKVNLGEAKLVLAAGPYIGIGIYGKTKYEYSIAGAPDGVGSPLVFGIPNSTKDIKYGKAEYDDLRVLDYGINFVVGIEYKKISLRVQYGLGIANINPIDNSAFAIKNKVIGISATYMLGK